MAPVTIVVSFDKLRIDRASYHAGNASENHHRRVVWYVMVLWFWSESVGTCGSLVTGAQPDLAVYCSLVRHGACGLARQVAEQKATPELLIVKSCRHRPSAPR